MIATQELSLQVGKLQACEALGSSRATFYRWENPSTEALKPRRSPPRALSAGERENVLEILNSERFQDQAPQEVYATLLDEEEYLCSIRTMYRILDENGESRERRDQLRHPAYKKPELLATGPNEVWSWDITKLLGPEKWTYYYLYVILDIFSRYVAGWMVASVESAPLAKKLIEETLLKEEIVPGKLTIHADRGPSMSSKPVAFLMADLGITKSHSRPHVSNDNPFSEAQFKTLKYRPEFPERFGSLEDAKTFSRAFFDWYNREHHHSGIGLLTPEVMHLGQAEDTTRLRGEVLTKAYTAHPERFVNKHPLPPRYPKEAWINPPKEKEGAQAAIGGEKNLPGSPISDDLDGARVKVPHDFAGEDQELKGSTPDCCGLPRWDIPELFGLIVGDTGGDQEVSPLVASGVPKKMSEQYCAISSKGDSPTTVRILH